MQLLLRDPTYTDRLASFLTSVGQSPTVAGPDLVELGGNGESSRVELEIYLRVWRVLHPNAVVELAA